jgi:exonuclease III
LVQNNGILNKDLLNRHGVHPNPGPETNPNEKLASNLSLITYNCRGLRNKNKLRTLLAKISKLVKKGAIVGLQETHAISKETFDLYWKEGSVLNCKANDQKGVILLFNSSYTIEKISTDENDRSIIVSLKNELLSLIVANVYCPNNVNENSVFFRRHIPISSCLCTRVS